MQAAKFQDAALLEDAMYKQPRLNETNLSGATPEESCECCHPAPRSMPIAGARPVLNDEAAAVETSQRDYAANVDSARKLVLRRRIRIVVSLTIAWNVIEALAALVTGGIASSAALVAFGLDSVIEVLSALTIIWQFSAPNPQSREKTAMRVIAFAFFALAVYVSVNAILSLVGIWQPESSPIGIVIAILSLIVMPCVSWFERKTGRELGSASAVADSKQTLICAYLSAALLAGLVLNTVFGWQWADSVAALVIALFAIREGIETLHGSNCCASAAAVLANGAPSACADGCV